MSCKDWLVRMSRWHAEADCYRYVRKQPEIPSRQWQRPVQRTISDDEFRFRHLLSSSATQEHQFVQTLVSKDSQVEVNLPVVPQHNVQPSTNV